MKISLVRFAPVAIPEMLERIPADDPERRLYDRCRLRPGARVLIDRDQPVGYVHELARTDDYDGLWHAALIEIDTPPAWLKKGTPVSLGANTISRGSMFGREVTREALVREISLVSAGCEPAEPLAKVMTLRDKAEQLAPLATQVSAPRRAAAPAQTRSGQVDELAWVDALVDAGWSFDDAVNHVARECGYDSHYLSNKNRRRRVAA